MAKENYMEDTMSIETVSLVGGVFDANHTPRFCARARATLGVPVTYFASVSTVMASIQAVDALIAADGRHTAVLIATQPLGEESNIGGKGQEIGVIKTGSSFVFALNYAYALSALQRISESEVPVNYITTANAVSIANWGQGCPDYLFPNKDESNYPILGMNLVIAFANEIIKKEKRYPFQTMKSGDIPDLPKNRIWHTQAHIDRRGRVHSGHGDCRLTTLNTEVKFENEQSVPSINGVSIRFYERSSLVPQGKIGLVPGFSGVRDLRFLDLVSPDVPVAKTLGLKIGDKVNIPLKKGSKKK
jgi:hypothetical protein